jgi:hypothetical protein
MFPAVASNRGDFRPKMAHSNDINQYVGNTKVNLVIFALFVHPSDLRYCQPSFQGASIPHSSSGSALQLLKMIRPSARYAVNPKFT